MGVNCSNVSWINDSMITALTPRGTGKDIPLLVFVGNGVSFPTLFSYLRPYISNVSVHMHGGILLMTGKHFGVPGTKCYHLFACYSGGCSKGAKQMYNAETSSTTVMQ